MTEPTTDHHHRSLHSITGNAIDPALALIDAGAIPPPPPDLDAPRHTASAITDAQLAALYGELDGAIDDLMHERRHNDSTCEAVQRRDQFEQLLRGVVQLADVTHRFHDSLGVGLTCAGCALHARIRDTLDNQEPK